MLHNVCIVYPQIPFGQRVGRGWIPPDIFRFVAHFILCRLVCPSCLLLYAVINPFFSPSLSNSSGSPSIQSIFSTTLTPFLFLVVSSPFFLLSPLIPLPFHFHLFVPFSLPPQQFIPHSSTHCFFHSSPAYPRPSTTR